jgi:hypothetical protein
MDNHTYGEIFEREAPGPRRSSRSSTQYMQSYNEDLIAQDFGEREDGDAHPSTFPCTDFMIDAGIHDDFLYLVDRVGLTDYMNDESEQYASLTKTFVESFHFSSTKYNPSVTFKIYDKSITLPLPKFCSILGINSYYRDIK